MAEHSEDFEELSDCREMGVFRRQRNRPITRTGRVAVELTIRTSGNHQFAVREAVAALAGIGAVGADVDHGCYEFEVIKGSLSGSSGGEG